MTTLAFTAEAANARPVIAWYNKAKRDCNECSNVWQQAPDLWEIVVECKERVAEVRDTVANLRNVRGYAHVRKENQKALADMEDFLLRIRRATNKYTMALLTRNFFRAYERHQPLAVA